MRLFEAFLLAAAFSAACAAQSDGPLAVTAQGQIGGEALKAA